MNLWFRIYKNAFPNFDANIMDHPVSPAQILRTLIKLYSFFSFSFSLFLSIYSTDFIINFFLDMLNKKLKKNLHVDVFIIIINDDRSQYAKINAYPYTAFPNFVH